MSLNLNSLCPATDPERSVTLLMESMSPIFPGVSESATCAVMEPDVLERVNVECSGGKLSGSFVSAPLGLTPISDGAITGLNTVVCGDLCAPRMDRVESSGVIGELGLLGLAFHPDFGTNRRFYVYYAANPTTTQYTLRLSEFTATGPDSAPVGDPSSENILLEFDKPGPVDPVFEVHNGGLVFFGADGMLYLSIGDGAGHILAPGPADPVDNGQNLATLFGSVIRIDVNEPFRVGQPYRIPADNPFVGRAGVREEIFSYGLRNPFRCSVDRGETRIPDVFAYGKNRGRIFCGDVGESSFEEIDILQSGGNFGWDAKEGFSCLAENQDKCLALEGDVLPIHTYSFATSRKSVMGGYVYRGCKNPTFRGLYIFGDTLTGGDLCIFHSNAISYRSDWDYAALSGSAKCEQCGRNLHPITSNLKHFCD